MGLMLKRILWVLLAIGLLLTCLGIAGSRRKPTDHTVTASSLGVASRSGALEAVIDQPGPVTVETVVGADWVVPRSGMINLNHPTAKAAHLTDGPEPIKIFFHAIHHPTK